MRVGNERLGDLRAARRRLPAAVFASFLVLPGLALAASGGPDAFGYTWLDQSEAGGPSYNYEVESVPVTSMDDEAFTTVDLPFAFPWYGVEYATVDVHSNGALSFGATDNINYQHDCGALSPGLGAASILPYWADLDPSQAGIGSGVFIWERGVTPDRMFVVEYYQVPHFDTPGVITFEVKLFEDGRVEFHYQDLDVDGSDKDNGALAVIGISSGDSGMLLISCDNLAPAGQVVGPGAAIAIAPPGCADDDGDGYTVCEDDCDDTDEDVHPGAEEICNGSDDDCDGALPHNEEDFDGDGFSPCADDCNDNDDTLTPADLDQDGWSTCDGDCDDDDGDVSPDDVDGDGASGCDGDCDDTDASLNTDDEDQDGVSTCEGDCDDDDNSVRPGLAELCDDKDNDCDGDIDENPNCGGDDDDDDAADDDDATPPGWNIPYGCILDCSHTGRPDGRLGVALAALLGASWGRRRRNRRRGPAA